MQQKVIRPPLSIRLRMWRRRWIYLLWILLVPLALMLIPDDRLANRATGIVESQTQTVGPSETVQIAEICVLPGQRVDAGDTLALFHAPRTEMDNVAQEMRLAEFQTDARRREQNLMTLLARARQSLQTVEATEAETIMNRARDEAELKGLREELQRQNELIEKKLAPTTEIARIRPQITAFEDIVTHYPALLASLQTQKEQITREITETEGWLREEQQASRQEIARLELALKTATAMVKDSALHVLRATNAGTVSRIRHQVGDIVPAGEPVLRITTDAPPHVVGLFMTHQLAGIAEGTRLQVAPYHRPQRVYYDAEVILLEPEFLDLADPFNPAPRYPVRGRRVHIRLLSPENDLVSGESVGIILPQPPFGQRLVETFNRFKDRFFW